jgi:2-methylisocitrate lyase-like PEP mutase family enzyme
MRNGLTITEMIKRDGMIIAPGAYDGLTAKLVRDAGFSAVYMSGGSVSAGYGYPDYGLLTMSEMVETAARMADAVDLPIIADADTGYGNELNTYRTVRDFERAGVAAVQIEDQVSPKRCGHLDDKQIVPADEFTAKIRAAADARRNPGLAIIARTDARAVEGFEEAVQRCNAALAAGADIAFLEAPQTLDEIRAVPKAVNGPCLLNLVYGGKTPMVDMKTAADMGFGITIVPGIVVTAAITAIDAALAALRDGGEYPELHGHADIRAIFHRAGAADWDPLRTRYQ